ncbi:MAG: hypothetical protein M3468_11985 [Acidobacteriota bacterium]|nr:hypothetical protein [Acidobacteriota bacterium]
MAGRPGWGNENGAALLLVIMLVLVLGAIGAAVSVATRTETLIAANFRQGRETLYVAEGALAQAVHDLATQPDWSTVLAGAALSTFTDGAATGQRTLPGGDIVTLCCGQPSLTSDVQERALGGRSWGADTPVWQMFAWGRAADWLPAGRIDSAMYVVVWVADDPEDGDGNAAIDSNGVVLLHGHALGPRGGRQVIDAAIGRDTSALAPVRIISWREGRW